MSNVHVVPLRDLIEHEVPGGLAGHENDEDPWLTIVSPGPEVSCPCNPTVECCPSEDSGPDGWLWIHHSLDARESAGMRLTVSLFGREVFSINTDEAGHSPADHDLTCGSADLACDAPIGFVVQPNPSLLRERSE